MIELYQFAFAANLTNQGEFSPQIVVGKKRSREVVQLSQERKLTAGRNTKSKLNLYKIYTRERPEQNIGAKLVK